MHTEEIASYGVGGVSLGYNRHFLFVNGTFSLNKTLHVCLSTKIALCFVFRTAMYCLDTVKGGLFISRRVFLDDFKLHTSSPTRYDIAYCLSCMSEGDHTVVYIEAKIGIMRWSRNLYV